MFTIHADLYGLIIIMNVFFSCEISSLFGGHMRPLMFTKVIGVVEVSSGGFKIGFFLPKYQGDYWILRIGVMGRCQKLGIILENKLI